MTIGVAIPAYKNVESLRRCLSSLYLHLGSGFEPIVVVDDSGNGMIAKALRDEYSRVNWIVHERNQGFGYSANEAVIATQCDVTILLNDDTEVVSDPRPLLTSTFENSALFAVGFQSMHADKSFREGAKRVVWRLGIPRVLHNPRDQVSSQNGVQHTDYVVGGHGAYHRQKFAQLGGMDDFFSPFYWEDVDLSFRAHMRGWKTIYLQDCRVIHDGASAIRDHHSQESIRETVWRNRLRFASRHASGVHRLLLPLSRIYLYVSAIVRQDRPLLNAIIGTRNTTA